MKKATDKETEKMIKDLATISQCFKYLITHINKKGDILTGITITNDEDFVKHIYKYKSTK